MVEAVFVGATLAVAMALLAWLLPQSLHSIQNAALAGFFLGLSFHLGFEISGLNKTYCSTGHACGK